MVLKFIKNGEKMGKEGSFKPYSKTGSVAEVCVWPALLLHEGGPLIAKGFALPQWDIRLFVCLVQKQTCACEIECGKQGVSNSIIARKRIVICIATCACHNLPGMQKKTSIGLYI